MEDLVWRASSGDTIVTELVMERCQPLEGIDDQKASASLVDSQPRSHLVLVSVLEIVGVAALTCPVVCLRNSLMQRHSHFRVP